MAVRKTQTKTHWRCIREIQGPRRTVAAGPFMQNEPNSPCFWPKNADLAKKRSQTKPIATESGHWATLGVDVLSFGVHLGILDDTRLADSTEEIRTLH